MLFPSTPLTWCWNSQLYHEVILFALSRYYLFLSNSLNPGPLDHFEPYLIVNFANTSGVWLVRWVSLPSFKKCFLALLFSWVAFLLTWGWSAAFGAWASSNNSLFAFVSLVNLLYILYLHHILLEFSGLLSFSSRRTAPGCLPICRSRHKIAFIRRTLAFVVGNPHY